MKESYKFIYIVCTSSFVCIYVILITFLHIDEKQQRFADTALGFLLGTVLGGGISYLLGGSALPHTNNNSNNNKQNKMTLVFWDIKSLDNAVLAIDGVTSTAKVLDLPNIDSRFSIGLDNTGINVLMVNSSVPVDLSLNDPTFGDYESTSVVSDFEGGRPVRKPK